MSQILVGTASWTDKSLIQSARFYPPPVKTPEDRLRYYATQFPVVEVDSSYYAMPSAHNAQLWAERTPDLGLLGGGAVEFNCAADCGHGGGIDRCGSGGGSGGSLCRRGRRFLFRSANSSPLRGQRRFAT